MLNIRYVLKRNNENNKHKPTIKRIRLKIKNNIRHYNSIMFQRDL